jgi:hypothetical protein
VRRLDFWGYGLCLIAAIVGIAGVISSASAPGLPRCHGTRELRDYHDKAALAAAQGIRDPWNYELDHYIPLCLGGADDESNLRFQPWSAARKKDDLEWAVCGLVCRGEMTQQEGIDLIKRAWPEENEK